MNEIRTLANCGQVCANAVSWVLMMITIAGACVSLSRLYIAVNAHTRTHVCDCRDQQILNGKLAFGRDWRADGQTDGQTDRQTDGGEDAVGVGQCGQGTAGPFERHGR